jgi:hypothetical protein
MRMRLTSQSPEPRGGDKPCVQDLVDVQGAVGHGQRVTNDLETERLRILFRMCASCDISGGVGSRDLVKQCTILTFFEDRSADWAGHFAVSLSPRRSL